MTAAGDMDEVAAAAGAAGMPDRSRSLERMVRRGRGIGDLRRRLPSSGELAECR